MNSRDVIGHAKSRVRGTAVLINPHGIILAALVLLFCVPALAQNTSLQQELAAVKQAVAENKQRLHQYQWTETVTLTLEGEARPPSQNRCQYGQERASSEDSSWASAATTERWQTETKNH